MFSNLKNELSNNFYNNREIQLSKCESCVLPDTPMLFLPPFSSESLSHSLQDETSSWG